MKQKIQNNSGWHPAGQAILLRAIELEVAQAGAARGEKSRIAIPDEVKRSSAQCDTEGLVVAVGEDAWSDIAPRCREGDRVLFTKYAGGTIVGKDGYVYRMVNSHSIYAVADEE